MPPALQTTSRNQLTPPFFWEVSNLVVLFNMRRRDSRRRAYAGNLPMLTSTSHLINRDVILSAAKNLANYTPDVTCEVPRCARDDMLCLHL